MRLRLITALGAAILGAGLALAQSTHTSPLTNTVPARRSDSFHHSTNRPGRGAEGMHHKTNRWEGAGTTNRMMMQPPGAETIMDPMEK